MINRRPPKSPSRTDWSGVDLSSNAGAGVPSGKASFETVFTCDRLSTGAPFLGRAFLGAC
jgi:hypothetical protein